MDRIFKLSILALDEMSDAIPQSITHAVSLVDPGTPLPATLNAIAESQRLVLWMHDALDATNNRRPPSLADVTALCDFADRVDIEAPVHLLVHCHEGRSRSAAAAAILLMCMGVGTATSVFDLILAARCPVWPNWTMIELGDAALRCGGALEQACRQAYAHVRESHPVWVDDPRPQNAFVVRER
jgi:predicted protein tyrosine phosphatase